MAAVNTNNGAFKKGHDPRRFTPENKGMMEYHKRLSELLAENSDKAVDYLYEVMGDKKAPTALRMRAAEQILDRVHGKPVDRSVVATVDASDSTQDVSKISNARLLQLINQIDQENQPLEGEIIDVD